jgi:glucose-1-phosphate thymidylyltransferase
MKGILLAGGSGTRLYPLTLVTNKQLLPIYDKPMIYYPLSVLMSAGIRDILIISTPADAPRFETLLGDGARLGVRLSYAVQPSPDGLAQAFLLGRDFIGADPVAMVLGDNIFFGHGLNEKLARARGRAAKGESTIFTYYVEDPERFGIVSFDENGQPCGIEEKPENPKSNYCVTGLYFYDNRVVDFASALTPSARGQLEITDINRMYLEAGALTVDVLGQGFTWLDCGTHASLGEATDFVRTIETRQHRKIGCPEEIAYRNGWITKEQILRDIQPHAHSSYAGYLMDVLGGKYIDQ